MMICLVGKSGCGKSTVARKLQEIDSRMMHIDVDKISHQVLEFPEVQEALQKTFSPNVVIDGEVQRKVLGRIVFTTPEEMQKLTDITWIHMERLIDEIIENNPDKIIILDYILLPKTKYFKMSDLRVWIDAPIEDRLDRVIKRAVSGEEIDRSYFLKRDAAGINFEEDVYDFVIHNGNKNIVDNEVKKVYEKSILRG